VPDDPLEGFGEIGVDWRDRLFFIVIPLIEIGFSDPPPIIFYIPLSGSIVCLI
jgi:hypothetical protein